MTGLRLQRLPKHRPDPVGDPFVSAGVNTAAERRRAQLTVAGMALDVDDCRERLAQLELLERCRMKGLSPFDICVRCITNPGRVRAAAQICCSTHGAPLCHECYRRTHFVEVCVDGCVKCQAEGLAARLVGAA